MIPHGPRTLGYYAASHWFQWAVLFVVIGLLVVFGIMPALDDAKEQAERQAVELTIRNMRTGMQLAMGEALMQQREGEIVSWVGSNPVRWLSSSPVGYRGECSAAARRGLTGGEWCFDLDRRELLYRPRTADHLRALPEGAFGECSQLRWRVARVLVGVTSSSFGGLRLETVSRCEWVLE